MRAQENWEGLSAADKMVVARKAAEGHERKLMALPNVVTVGYGYRERADNLLDEPCVKVSVSKKWSSERQLRGKVPTWCLTSWVRRKNGKRRMYAVPTDVSRLGAIATHASAGAQTRSTQRGQTGSSEATGCCLVKFIGYDELCLLGCAHALARVANYDKPTSRRELQQFHTSAKPRNDQGAWRRIGELSTIAPLSKVDAALVRVGSLQGMTAELGNGKRISGIATGLGFPRYHTVYGKNNVVKSRLVEITLKVDVVLHRRGHARTYRYRNVPKSRPLNSSIRSTGPGDSGAPVITPDGFLAGMHFAGSGIYSYSFPIERVFGAFRPNLRLIR